MYSSIIQIVLILLAGTALGALVGWLIRGVRSNQLFENLHDEWQVKFDVAAGQRDKFHSENNKLRASLETLQAALHKHEIAASRGRTEIESMREKQKSLSKDMFSVGAERDEAKKELLHHKKAMASARRQIADLEAEFLKAGAFYKGELEKAFEKRKALEAKLDDSKAEQGSLANLLKAAKSEYESVNKMLEAAQNRLDNLDALERKAIKFEAENAQLRHDASRMQQEIEALQRDVEELEELKVQNRELSHCLKSMENSRRQYEANAQRYRDQADNSEKQSETLRVKLDDIEKNLADMAKQQKEANKHVRVQDASPETNGKEPPPEVDDLTEIVGIGKVFQHALHTLGIYSFKQIASFGPSDIARVNMALRENRGRMEQDDWIGQAKELYFKKYSERVDL